MLVSEQNKKGAMQAKPNTYAKARTTINFLAEHFPEEVVVVVDQNQASSFGRRSFLYPDVVNLCGR